jgi:type IV pilus assembly protein PilA
MTKLQTQLNLNRRRRTRRQKGFSLIELLIVIAIILVIMAIAVPNYNKYQMAGRETAVIKELEVIYGAQTLYYSSYGKYAANLSDLGPPTGGAEGPQGANMIPKTLADGAHNGYRYTMAGSGATFSVTAVPETFGSSGRRSFFMDQTKTIHFSATAEPANLNSPEMK